MELAFIAYLLNEVCFISAKHLPVFFSMRAYESSALPGLFMYKNCNNKEAVGALGDTAKHLAVSQCTSIVASILCNILGQFTIQLLMSACYARSCLTAPSTNTYPVRHFFLMCLFAYKNTPALHHFAMFLKL